jgi:UDP-glucose 4-epimerase
VNVLIIGSKGFIGTNLATIFKEDYGYDVFECDVTVDYENKKYYLIDATNADYHRLFQLHRFHVCINCSGAANVGDSLVNPLRDFTLNTYNVFKILDAIRIFQPECRFINLSSAAIYGNPQELPISEHSNSHPISPYGLHKLQAEMILKEFYTHYGIRNCSLRIFSAYGSGLRKQLFWDIFQKAKTAPQIELYGTGDESREFIHVLDIASAINCCILNAFFEGEAINIANGMETTVSQAVQTFLSFFPKHKRVSFNGQIKRGDPLYWKADISALKSMGYSPAINLPNGLENYFKWVSRL